MSKRFYELIETGERDERSGEEIAEDIIARAGLIRGGVEE